MNDKNCSLRGDKQEIARLNEGTRQWYKAEIIKEYLEEQKINK